MSLNNLLFRTLPRSIDLRKAICFACVVFVLLGSMGCDSIARSQGKFPITGFYPPNDPRLQDPEDPNLNNGVDNPLVRIAYRTPWRGKVVDFKKILCEKDRVSQGYYAVVDVSNLFGDPSLGTNSEEVYKQRLGAIAELLVLTADANGEVYWRHLTAFLETYGATDAATQVAFGSSIPASFISPVLGASLAGSALLVDTFVDEYVSGLNIDEYAAMREAASTYRKVLKSEIFTIVEDATPESRGVHDVLQKSYDYAFTYSIKGAIHAAVQQNDALKEMLITGESPWRQHFKDEIIGYQKQKLLNENLTEEQRKKINAFINAQETPAEIDAEIARIQKLIELDKIQKEYEELKKQNPDQEEQGERAADPDKAGEGVE